MKFDVMYHSKKVRLHWMITYDIYIKIKFIYFNQRKYNSDIINKEDFDIPDLKNIVANIKLYKKKNIVVNSNINYVNILKYMKICLYM